jgi:hypothetical protein
MPADVRALLTQGNVDPRLVALLTNAVSHHTIGIGQMESIVDPVHAESIDVVSVDGQPVSPSNVAARDLITEIAALDPSIRPNEIGTPWPIQSQGFFTDAVHQGRLHLAFVSQADYEPSGTPASASAAAASAGPVAATPAAAGAAQAADAALAAPGTGSSAAPASVPQPGVAPPASAGEAAGQLAAATGASPGPAAQTPAGYVNPLPADAQIGRTDMGVDVDLKPGEPIVAPGTSRVLGVMQNWYQGQPYVALQLLDGPMKGHNYYIAEQIDPAVAAGQVIQQGQPIAHYASSGTGIEMGWAGANWEQTLAQAEGNTGDPSHNDAPAGIAFHNFLMSLPHNAPGSAAAGCSLASGAAPGTAGAAPSAGAPGAPVAQGGAVAPVAPASPVAAAYVAPVAPASPVAAASVAPVASATPVESAAATPSGAGAGPPAAPTPTAPGQSTAPFEAAHRHERARNTVQFLAAVQPSSTPPVGVQGPAAVGGAAAVNEIAGTPGVQPQVAGVPAAGQQAADLVSAQPPGSGLAPAPSGGAIVVQSQLLTSGQQLFAGRLAQLTGLDPRVISAWVLAEESGGAAQSRQAAGNFNWLNIGYFDSGAGHIAFDKAFGDPVSAAEQTARFLEGKWGGASPGIQAILQSVGHSPAQQMTSIANSGWASSHYDNGRNLIGTYDELSDLKVTAQSPGTGAAANAVAAGAESGAVVAEQASGAGEPRVQAMVAMANSLIGKPYVVGGGHASFAPSSGYDCSGFVSAVLHAGGYLNAPVDTTMLPSQPGILSGPGQLVTIYDRALPGESGHVIIDVNGQFYESGGMHGAWGGGGGVEKIGRPSDSYLASFDRILHPDGL